MNLDTTTLVLSLIFGCIGTGLFMYGKKTQQYIHLGAGLGLMGVPYFIPNAIAMVVVCVALTAVPFVANRFA